MAKFLIGFLLILIMIVEKLFFFSLEGKFSATFQAKLELFALLTFFIFGVYSYLSKYFKTHTKRGLSINSFKFTILPVFLIFASLFSIGLSLKINLNKASVHWDAIALYDARAKFLQNDLKFSEMISLSEYDNLNKYYYLLYPPYTSIAHYFWYNTPFLSDIPVGVYYSLNLAVLCLLVFIFLREQIGLMLSLALTFLVSSNSSVFNVAIKEYTNMPYTLFIVAGLLFLFSYLKSGQTWEFLFASLLISTSAWIRFLEPMWLVIIIAFSVASYSKGRFLKSILFTLPLFLLCILEYNTWSFFIKSIGNSPGFLDTSIISIIDPILGIFTGALLNVTFVFISGWGVLFFIHLMAILSAMLLWKRVTSDKSLLFAFLVIILSIALYFAQLYFVSFQSTWWVAASKSLDRSSTFLVPITLLLLISLIKISDVSSTNAYGTKNKINK